MQNLILHQRLPSQVWMEACRRILQDGNFIKDGEQGLLELCNVSLLCDCPSQMDEFLSRYGDQRMIRWMKQNFLEQEPVLDWGYSYGQRIFAYSGFDQMQNLVNKLKTKPEAKSATVNLMDIRADAQHMPCICTLDFKIRRGALQACAFFRSQDAGKKLYADILALSEIMQILARHLALPVGALTLFVASLHVYEPDRPWLEQCLKHYDE